MNRKYFQLFDQVMLFLPLLLNIFLFFYVVDTSLQVGDDSSYVAQAEALAKGQVTNYLLDQVYIHQNTRPIGPFVYNWGLSAMYAGIIQVFETNIVLLKCINLLFFIVAYFLFADFCKRRLGRLFYLPLLLLCSNPYLLNYQNRTLSDHIFMSLSLICILAYLKLARRYRQEEISETWYATLIFILGLIPLAFRINGGVISIAFAMTETWRLYQDPKITLRNIFKVWGVPYLKAAIVVTLISLIWNSFFPHGGMLSKQMAFPFSISHFWQGLTYYSGVTYSFWELSRPLSFGLSFFILPIIFTGVYFGLKRDHALALFLMGTFALYCFINLYENFRYLICVVPYFLYFFYLVVYESSKRGLRYLQYPIAVASILLCCFWTKTVIDSKKDVFPYHYGNSKESMELFDYISKNTSDSQSISFYKPRLLYLFTKRRAHWISNRKRLDETDIKIVRNRKGFYSWMVPKYKLLFENRRYRIYGEKI